MNAILLPIKISSSVTAIGAHFSIFMFLENNTGFGYWNLKQFISENRERISNL